jgi:hypothetical protein
VSQRTTSLAAMSGHLLPLKEGKIVTAPLEVSLCSKTLQGLQLLQLLLIQELV